MLISSLMGFYLGLHRALQGLQLYLVLWYLCLE